MKAILDVYLKNEHIERIDLTGEVLSIGRKQENGLVLHDLTVSRNHAKLSYLKDGKYWRLENISATNPVKLNGDPLARPEILFDDDHIFIGTYTLIYRENDGTEKSWPTKKAPAEAQSPRDAAAKTRPPERTKVVSQT